ncbi:MAG: LptF/LptG family permease, partial [SAR324 cluster bacterium]|nr:LptF/LptG family permease [SAR324 cluster bacterium]
YLPENDPQKFQTVDFKTLNYLLEFQPENSVSENLLKRTGTLQLIRKLETFAPGSISKFRWLAELYGRLILPWVCLVFSLAAIPMAIVDPRSGRSGSYLRAFFLVVTFYLVWVGFKDLVSGGKAPPATLVLPLVLIFLYGLLRLWQIDWEVRPLAALANFRTSRR